MVTATERLFVEELEPDTIIEATALTANIRRLSVRVDGDMYIHRQETQTCYDNPTIQAILKAKGPAYLCDEIERDEQPDYIRRHLELTIKAHVDPTVFCNKRFLDFGCGAGASTVALARLLPGVELVGLELEEQNLAAARARIAFYGVENVTLLRSPAEDQLPEDIGKFDGIMLPAVVEHLLPDERLALLPQLWGLLNPGGYFFIDETPWRWFPIETHTTGLPLISYLPDAQALSYARRARRISNDSTWPELLRAGIRGCTLQELDKLLGPEAERITPSREGVRHYVDLWQEGYTHGNSSATAKRWLAAGAQFLHKAFGVNFVPYLSAAWKKTTRVTE